PRFDARYLGALARAATRWLSHEMEHERIALHLDLDVQRLPVWVDRIQIEQVLVNLMQNAVDAIRGAEPAGGGAGLPAGPPRRPSGVTSDPDRIHGSAIATAVRGSKLHGPFDRGAG